MSAVKHDLKLVYRIAEVLCDLDFGEGAWEESRVSLNRHDSLSELYLPAALAALDAMPQPVGYGLLFTNPGCEPRVSLSSSREEALRESPIWTRPPTVVALVPVEVS